MLRMVKVEITFSIESDAEAAAIIEACRIKAAQVGTHSAEEIQEEGLFGEVQHALEYLMVDAALDLPIRSIGVSGFAEDVTPDESTVAEINAALAAKVTA